MIRYSVCSVPLCLLISAKMCVCVNVKRTVILFNLTTLVGCCAKQCVWKQKKIMEARRKEENMVICWLLY